MLKSRVIPCLLLKKSGLVKTIKFKSPNYIGDPINAIKLFNDKEVDELIFLDIDASKNSTLPNLDLIKDISSESFMPLCYGGGIKDLVTMEKLFKIGVEKLSINSAFLANPNLVKQASENFGSQAIVVSLDVKKNILGQYEVYSHAKIRFQNRNLADFIKLAEDVGAGEFLINSVDQDGTMNGYDINLIKYITGISNVPVIACGGAGDYKDIKKVICDGGASAAAAGSIFVYFGVQKGILINYPTREELELLIP